MPIYQTAHYQVNASAVGRVKAAIAEFVDYVAKNEPGSEVYAAWQQKDDPTKFVHLFKFRDRAAQDTHSGSEAVRKFEAVYGPELVGGPVRFTDYEVVASNGPSVSTRARSL